MILIALLVVVLWLILFQPWGGYGYYGPYNDAPLPKSPSPEELAARKEWEEFIKDVPT